MSYYEGAPVATNVLPDFNYASLGSDLVAPTVISTEVPGEVVIEKPKQGTGARVAKIIVIVILVIFIIVTVILAIMFRNNLNNCKNKESVWSPTLICPINSVNFPNVVPDPVCGASAFRIDENGKKMCSTTRYLNT